MRKEDPAATLFVWVVGLFLVLPITLGAEALGVAIFEDTWGVRFVWRCLGMFGTVFALGVVVFWLASEKKE